MWLQRDITVGESAAKYNLLIEQWSYFYLQLNIVVPPDLAVWTTTEGQEATRARCHIRQGIRDDNPVLTLDSDGGSPKIIIDNTNAPALVVIYIRMDALFTGTFEADDESAQGRVAWTIVRELTQGVYDIVIELDDTPGLTLRVMQGEITLSEQVTRPIS